MQKVIENIVLLVAAVFSAAVFVLMLPMVIGLAVLAIVVDLYHGDYSIFAPYKKRTAKTTAAKAESLAEIRNETDVETEADDGKVIADSPKSNPKVSAALFVVAIVLFFVFASWSSKNSSPSRPSFTPPAYTPAPGVWIDSHYRNGVLVPGHYRSHADNLPENNWSSKGNVNPVTGEPGYRSP